MWPKVADPIQREALGTALKEMESLKPGDEKATEARRALIRALLTINPMLPLDEYASEELNVSLFHGRDALFVSDQPRRPPRAILSGFEKVELVAQWEEKRRGMPLRLIRVFACHNYRSLPL